MFGLNRFPDDERLKLKIGNDIIEAIQKNTKSGHDKDGKAFKKYSKAYKESFAFKAFGKSGQVNMTLSGDMLDLMSIIDDTPNTITIGWDDEKEKLKAENHIHGVTLPKRNFLGLPKDLLEKIVEKNRGLVERVADDETTEKDEERLRREELAEEA